jgi:hypothetical protein
LVEIKEKCTSMKAKAQKEKKTSNALKEENSKLNEALAQLEIENQTNKDSLSENIFKTHAIIDEQNLKLNEANGKLLKIKLIPKRFWYFLPSKKNRTVVSAHAKSTFVKCFDVF